MHGGEAARDHRPAVFGIAVGQLILDWIARRVWKHQKGRTEKLEKAVDAQPEGAGGAQPEEREEESQAS